MPGAPGRTRRAWPREFCAPEPQVESSAPRVPASLGRSGRVESSACESKAGPEHAGAAPTRESPRRAGRRRGWGARFGVKYRGTCRASEEGAGEATVKAREVARCRHRPRAPCGWRVMSCPERTSRQRAGEGRRTLGSDGASEGGRGHPMGEGAARPSRDPPVGSTVQLHGHRVGPAPPALLEDF